MFIGSCWISFRNPPPPQGDLVRELLFKIQSLDVTAVKVNQIASRLWDNMTVRNMLKLFLIYPMPEPFSSRGSPLPPSPNFYFLSFPRFVCLAPFHKIVLAMGFRYGYVVGLY
jgi:hypothetical protein